MCNIPVKIENDLQQNKEVCQFTYTHVVKHKITKFQEEEEEQINSSANIYTFVCLESESEPSLLMRID